MNFLYLNTEQQCSEDNYRARASHWLQPYPGTRHGELLQHTPAQTQVAEGLSSNSNWRNGKYDRLPLPPSQRLVGRGVRGESYIRNDLFGTGHLATWRIEIAEIIFYPYLPRLRYDKFRPQCFIFNHFRGENVRLLSFKLLQEIGLVNYFFWSQDRFYKI